MSSLNYIDLFAGAGGLSEGFNRAGFNAIAHVESDINACKTLETRNAFFHLESTKKLSAYNSYLKGNLSREDLLNSIPTIEKSVINQKIGENNSLIFELIDERLKGNKVDLLIGGPPCQAYSVVGRHRILKLDGEDPRNLLYKEYAKFLKKYEPKVFVFENVVGLLSADQGKYFENLKKHFKSIGYELDYRVLNAADFNVLQQRKRVIIIGWKKGINFEYPIFNAIKCSATLKDLLDDLPFLEPGDNEPIKYYTKSTNSYLELAGIRQYESFITQHITRKHNERDLAIYKIAVEKWLNNRERLKYPDLPVELKTHKNEKAFIDRFKVVDIHTTSHTILAHIAKDGHYFIYPSLEQVRSLSVREVARIQSFPDNFYFEGGRTAAFRQIGNAVPPLMAYEIAKEIKKLLL